MSDQVFNKIMRLSRLQRLVQAVLVLAVLAAGYRTASAQNMTRPNIEGPSGLQVNSYTGSLFTQRSDLFIPGRGLSLDITFSYNSSARDIDFGFGFGWTLSWNQFYLRDSTGQGVTIHHGDGRRDHYLKSGAGWTAPKGIFDILTEYEAGKFVLRSKSGTQHFFDNPANGKLTRVRDRNGNEIILAWAGNNLSSLTDASGRVITFSWVNGHVQEIRAEGTPAVRVIRYEYNTAGCLISVKDPVGNLTSYAYGAGRLMTSLTTPNRFTASVVYYGQGAVSKLVSCQREQSITYNTAQLKAYVIEKGQGKTVSTTYAFDGEGRVVERTGNCCGFRNSYGYDQDNNIAFITDAAGNTTRYGYDRRGNPVTETDPLGRSLTYTYEAQFNQVTSLTDKNGNKTTFRYDATGNLTETVNAVNTATRFTYDAFGNRLTATDGRGAITAWTYDSYGNAHTITDPAGIVDNYAYDAWGNVLSHTDANSNKTTFVYDNLNRLLSQRDALNGELRYTYDASGNRLTSTDARGHVAAFRYDENDRPVSVTDAMGNISILEYDAFGNMVAGIDALGQKTSYGYDHLNRLVSATNATGETTSFAYDANGNRISATMPNGNTIRFAYDALNRMVETADNLGRVSAIEYDPNGNRLSERNGNGHATTYRYDALNRLIAAADASGSVVSYAYDVNGNLLTETDRNGHATTYAYDLLGQLVSQTDALNHATTYTYDKLGNAVSVTDARGNITSYAFDALSRKTLERYADNSTRAFTYDAAGNLLTRKDNKGVVTEYRYDSLNRLTARQYPDANESFAYDAVGRMLSAKNTNAAVTFAYDQAGRLASETLNGKTTAYAYNAAAGTKTITYPGGRTVRRNMDMRNRLKTIREGASSLAEFGYDAIGQVVSRKYANNVATSFSYDGNGRITGLAGNPSRFMDLGFTYDREGNPQAAQFKHLPARSEAYRYDPLGQVTGFQKGASPQSVFNFDAVGNRTTAQVNGATISYAVDEMNAYVSAGGRSFSYDGNGNLTSDSRNTYAYDFENRMTAVNNGTKASYLYDALGRRIRKVTGADTISYFYDGQQVIEERGGADSLLASYVWGAWIDDIVSMTRQGAAYFYHANTIGSVTSITNGSGAVVERYDYDAWGNLSVFDGNYAPLSISSIGNAYTFTGRQMEWETGFYFYRARNYDPEHGRFLQRDPLGYVDGLGLYAYVGNRPSTMVDPMGTEMIGFCGNDDYWDRYQEVLSWYGMLPGAGIFFDLLNTGISLARGQYGNAALNAIAIIPILGDAFAALRKAGKLAQYSENLFDIVTKVAKNSNNSGRVFWAGGDVAKEAAEKFAAATGGTTIGMTRAGQNLDKLISSKGIPWEGAKGGREMWERLSRAYAKGAEGPVHFFPNPKGYNPNSIWETVEKPILQEKQITIIVH